jgi:hypothetical protein
MAINRADLAGALRQLRDNANWKHYVTTLETHYNDRMKALVLSDHPDECLRGECRALYNLLLNINKNSGDLTS